MPELNVLNAEMQEPTIQVNEMFGPTLQGEGIDIGRPCVFIRLHHCPVKCPGCDTYYTWDGSERGESTPLRAMHRFVLDSLNKWPGVGVILSGGEPLIHWKNEQLNKLIASVAQKTWIALETSGFVGPQPLGTDVLMNEKSYQFSKFLRRFTTVHLSPKITPCLHGQWTYNNLLANIPLILNAFCWDQGMGLQEKLVLKFVVRDEEDMRAVDEFVDRFQIGRSRHRVYLMPYGIERDEILATCERMIPWLARTGYTLSPRLHSILWGPKRGV